MKEFTQAQIQGYAAKVSALKIYLESHDDFTSSMLAAAMEERANNISTGALTPEFDQITYAALYAKHIDNLVGRRGLDDTRSWLMIIPLLPASCALFEEGIGSLFSSVALIGLGVLSIPALIVHVIYKILLKNDRKKYLASLDEYDDFYRAISPTKTTTNRAEGNIAHTAGFSVPSQDN